MQTQTVIVPTYNEVRAIAPTLAQVLVWLASHPLKRMGRRASNTVMIGRFTK